MSEQYVDQSQTAPNLKLIYVIGRYPELTTTFIEREIDVLRRLGNIELETLSIRRPLTLGDKMPNYREIIDSTLYLDPVDWPAFIAGHVRFAFLQPRIYFGTLIYLLRHEHPSLKDRLITIFHFGWGIYAAHLLRSRQFQHIHAHFIDRSVVIALLVGRLLKKSYSLTAHANSIFRKKILIREKIVNARFMVTVSEYNKAYLLQNYAGLNPEKIHILHPWVDVSKFTPPPARKAGPRLCILSVGRLVEKKGHRDLIDACRILHRQNIDFECRIAGNGPLMSQLQAQIAGSGLEAQVRLLGGILPAEVMNLLRDWADVFALPCVIAADGDRDGIPVALAEAMAMELPVISTDIVGIAELVRPGAGLLVPAHNPQALAEALQTIAAESPETRRQMGRRGRAIVESDFNLWTGTTQLAALFAQTLS